ncbi:hypothetical protein GUJ93_ZPchr0011g27773 [Zizania palustris]|uniref:Protein kinase domain-containing protein n=1 Tax=Zizania palustris TaxID=103762 RepID=A0A8J5WJ29_ZIZPA|nr:hypothetical protein GUJ93_ZPchr0011g27773 [Zizania palustris]
MDPTDVSFRLLEEITDGFSAERKLGEGAYGTVYKGERKNGDDIAVKMLHNDTLGFDDKQFENEFQNLMRLEHPNIIRLVAYCYETQHKHAEYNGRIVFAATIHRALCFEYMSGGSLKDHLSDEFHGLDWPTRYKIIKGTCEGLKYLHEELKPPIYHLDLKPGNILLDKNMVPKLADFGLSKLFSEEKTRITQTPIGTFGYLPPEYMENNIVSNKLDIFSLGVVILNIIAGPRWRSRSADMSSQEFIDQVLGNWTIRLHETGNGSSLEAYCQEVKTCTQIAQRCLEIDRHKRPNIVDIINKINEKETKLGKVNGDDVRQPQRIDPVSSHQTMINIPSVLSMDVHPTEPWIIMGHPRGLVRIFDYDKKEEVQSFEVIKESPVRAAKFIPRKSWFVAGDYNGYIYVYSYEKGHRAFNLLSIKAGVSSLLNEKQKQRVKKFKAHDRSAGHSAILSMAVHPTNSYLLSAATDGVIKQWDWDQDWKCIQTFTWCNNEVTQIKFNPIDTNSFASASTDDTLKIWNIHSGHCEFKLNIPGVTSFDYFTRGDQLHLIAGCSDGTVVIWDYKKKSHGYVQTLKEHTDRVTSACSHPVDPILITGSWDGTICVWNSTTFRVDGKIKCDLQAAVNDIAYLKHSRRIVIAHRNGLTFEDLASN